MELVLPPAPDYARPEFWAFAPGNPVSVANRSRPADVFFLPGTLLSGFGPLYYDVTDPAHRALARRPFRTQASVFAAAGDIFQPHVRQVSMEVNMLPRPDLEAAYALPVGDTVAAFLHYLRVWNQGRPFLLAGHSQGAILMLGLMKAVLADSAVASRLVAAYLIGCSVTAADLAVHPFLRLAERADDTGVIITYNTLARGATRGLTLLPGALCVNPLNWTTGPEYASADRHLGMVKFDEQGEIVREIPHFTDAWIDPSCGGLIVGADAAQPAPPQAGAAADWFPVGDLHRYNLSFFYRNLEANALQRVKAFIG